MTVTVYVRDAPSCVTVTATVLLPVFQRALPPFVKAEPLTEIVTSAPSSTVAVIVLVAFVVSAVYSVTSALNEGVRESVPNVSAVRDGSVNAGSYTAPYQLLTAASETPVSPSVTSAFHG